MKAKRILSAILCIAMVLSTFSFTAFANTTDDIVTDGNAYATLEAAVAAASDGDIITLADGTYTMPNAANKNITIKNGEGQGNVVIEMLSTIGADGSTINFEGVTVKFDNGGYEGLQTPKKLTYTDCTHIGTEFLYADVVAYTNCTFEMYDENTEYAVWTYGADDVTFTNCVFNTNGKAILVYNEGAVTADIKVDNCKFTSNGKFTGKAAVEMGQSAYGNKATYTLTITESEADDNFSSKNSTSNLWGNKDAMALPSVDSESGTETDGLRVTVDGKAWEGYCAKIDKVTYDTLFEAVKSAKEGETITLMKDYAITGTGTPWTVYELSENATLDLNGNTLQIQFGQALFAGKNITIKNGTVTPLDGSQADYALYLGSTTGNNQEVTIPTVATLENLESPRSGINVLWESDVTLKDCTVTTDPDRTGAYAVATNNRAKVQVESGSYTGSATRKYDISKGTGATVTIYGGTFSQKVDEDNLAETCYTTIDANGKVVVKTGDPVAEVNSKKYMKLADAIAAAPTYYTVEVLKDFSENDITVAEGKNLIIDLNGYTVTGNFIVNGTATIKNGTVNADAKSAIENAGAASDLTVTDVNTSSASRHAIRVDGGKATITGGTHVGGYHGFSISDGAVVNINNVVSVTGTAFGAAIAVRGADDDPTVVSNVTINGATLSGEHDPIYAQLTAWGGSNVIVNDITCDDVSSDVAMTINGGTIGSVKTIGNGSYYITGGTFTTAPEMTYIADGYYPVKKNNVFVIGQDEVVEVNGIYYATFDEAWKEAIKAGGTKTITLLADVTHDSADYSTDMKSADLIIDLNGFNLTLNAKLPVGGSFYGGNKLTINDTENTGSVIFNNDSCIEFVDESAGTLIINGGKFVKTTGNTAIIKDNAWGTVNQTVTINSGDFSGVTGAVLGGKINENDIVTKTSTLNVVAPDGFKWENDTTLAKASTICKIGDTQYESIQAAINAANAGETIVLFKNQTENGITIHNNKDVIIDLSGKTVTGDFMVYGKATIKNGNIVGSSIDYSALEVNGANGDLTVEALNVTSLRHAIRADGGKLNVVSGTYVAKYAATTQYAINASSGAVVVITDGTFKANKEGISEGTYVIGSRGEGTTVTINGGNFSDSTGGVLTTDGVGTIVANAGTYDKDPSAYVAEGKEATFAGGVYTINGKRQFVIKTTTPEVYEGETVTVELYLDGTELYGATWELEYNKSYFKDTNDNTNPLKGFKSSGTLISDSEPIATYTFEAIAQTTEVYDFFTLKEGTSQTKAESINNIKVETEAYNADSKVTIKLRDFNVMVKVDGAEVTGDTLEIDYDNKEHKVEIIPNPEVSVSIMVNDKAQSLEYLNTLKGYGDYKIDYTVSKLGYAEKKGTFTLKIGAPDYYVEFKDDYVSGKKAIVLVHTDSDVVSFNYNGAPMLDVSYKNDLYTYEGKSYNKVFALVVDSIANGVLTDYEAFVEFVPEKVSNKLVVKEPNPEYDLTGDGKIDISDVTTAFGVYYADPYYLAEFMAVVLTADVNGDKSVNFADTGAYTTEFYNAYYGQ